MQDALRDFSEKIAEIMPQVAKEFSRRLGAELGSSDITLQQLFILEFVHSSKEPTMTQLARYMKVTTAAMTGAIERLVRDGYVSRIYDPKDRRIVRIKPNSRCSELIKRLHDRRHRMIVDVFGRLSQEDRRQYLRILTRIKEILSLS